jgi:phage gp29-like protein
LLLLPQNKEGIKELSYALELLEAKDTAWEGFKELILRNVSAVQIGLLGQTLTSGTGDGKGSYALGRVHADTMQTLISTDVGSLAHCLRRDLLAPWALYNKGNRNLAPIPFWDPLTTAQRKAEVDILKEFSDACVFANADTQVDWKTAGRRLRIPVMGRIPIIGEPPPRAGGAPPGQ